MTGKLLINRWMTKDGTILISRHRYDYQAYFDTVDKKWVFVDGGIEYVRTSGDLLDMCLYDTDSDHYQVRELYLWTSYGIDGKQPPETKPIKDLTVDHIAAILQTQTQLPEHVKNMFKRELAYRTLNS